VGKRYSSLEVTTSDRQELIARVDVHNIEVLFLSSDPDVRPSCGLVVLRKGRTLPRRVLRGNASRFLKSHIYPLV